MTLAYAYIMAKNFWRSSYLTAIKPNNLNISVGTSFQHFQGWAKLKIFN